MGKSAPRVLVVDDYILNQEVTKEMLEMLDCTVDVAESGQEAVDHYEPGKYDMIFMDIMMPEMDGVEASDLIRKKDEAGDEKKPLIVALTANALRGDREKYLALGLDDYIGKPVKLQDIEEMLKKHNLLD